MVDRSLPGITIEQLAAVQRAAIDMSRQVTAEGRHVRYIRSTFVPGESRCLCLFESADEETTRELNVRAQIPFNRIVEVVDLAPKSTLEH
jgi:hypothetical protein